MRRMAEAMHMVEALTEASELRLMRSCVAQSASKKSIEVQMEIDQDGHNTCDEYW